MLWTSRIFLTLFLHLYKALSQCQVKHLLILARSRDKNVSQLFPKLYIINNSIDLIIIALKGDFQLDGKFTHVVSVSKY